MSNSALVEVVKSVTHLTSNYTTLVFCHICGVAEIRGKITSRDEFHYDIEIVRHVFVVDIFDNMRLFGKM